MGATQGPSAPCARLASASRWVSGLPFASPQPWLSPEPETQGPCHLPRLPPNSQAEVLQLQIQLQALDGTGETGSLRLRPLQPAQGSPVFLAS